MFPLLFSFPSSLDNFRPESLTKFKSGQLQGTALFVDSLRWFLIASLVSFYLKKLLF